MRSEHSKHVKDGKEKNNEDLKDDKMITEMETNMSKVHQDIKIIEDLISKLYVEVKPSEGADTTVDISFYMNEVRDEFRIEIDSLLERICNLEDKQDLNTSSIGNSKAMIDLLQKSINSIEQTSSVMIPHEEPQPVIVTNEPTEPKEEVSKELLDQLQTKIDDKFSELSKILESKADIDNTENEFEAVKQNILDLQNKKYVDPYAHSVHSKEIKEIQEDLVKFYDIESDIKKLQDLTTNIERNSKSNEEYINQLLADMVNKSDHKDVSLLFSRSKTAESDINGLAKHLNDIQKQVDTFRQQKGPDFEKIIAALENKLENINVACNERINEHEKAIKDIREDLEDTRRMADKTDMNLIKLTQLVDSMKSKLDLLDEAFNGFMVPSNLLNSNTDSSAFDILKESLASLRREFFKFKDECSANFTLIGDTLSKNADKHDLKDLENRLTEKIDHNERVMMKNKAELRRLLRDTDDKLKRVNGGNVSRGNSFNRDDAMLARKHEGWKCATCEKDLVNMAGLPVEFFNWK